MTHTFCAWLHTRSVHMRAPAGTHGPVRALRSHWLWPCSDNPAITLRALLPGIPGLHGTSADRHGCMAGAASDAAHRHGRDPRGPPVRVGPPPLGTRLPLGPAAANKGTLECSMDTLSHSMGYSRVIRRSGPVAWQQGHQRRREAERARLPACLAGTMRGADDGCSYGNGTVGDILLRETIARWRAEFPSRFKARPPAPRSRHPPLRLSNLEYPSSAAVPHRVL
jgi:hypothetical protein